MCVFISIREHAHTQYNNSKVAERGVCVFSEDAALGAIIIKIHNCGQPHVVSPSNKDVLNI